MRLRGSNASDQLFEVLGKLSELTVENASMGTDIEVEFLPLFRDEDHGNTLSPCVANLQVHIGSSIRQVCNDEIRHFNACSYAAENISGEMNLIDSLADQTAVADGWVYPTVQTWYMGNTLSRRPARS